MLQTAIHITVSQFCTDREQLGVLLINGLISYGGKSTGDEQNKTQPMKRDARKIKWYFGSYGWAFTKIFPNL